jgi:hypothetical protein
MKRAGFNAIAGALLLFAPTSSSVGQPFALPGAKSAARYVDFSFHDARTQHVAKKLLAREMAEEADWPPFAKSLSTAWVNVSDARPPLLLVMYGCSATGNCDLYGFERTGNGWRMVLNSLAQMCWTLSSSHGGRRDISASMHGSATEATIKNYQWRRNRYVRVSERNVIYK